MSASLIGGYSIMGLAIVVPWYLAEVNYFFRSLERNDFQLWTEMGKPSLFSNNSPKNSFIFVKMLILNDFSKRKSYELVGARVRRMRILLALSLLPMTGLLVSFVLTE